MQLRLPRAERDLLAALFPQLAPVLEGSEHVAQLRGRLFPPAYDDDEHESEFRRMVDDDLVAERRAALDTVLRTLDEGHSRPGRWSVTLDTEAAQAWLTVLQDTRLVLAQVVGITTEADWEREPTEAEPDQLVLWHVGMLQEELLEVLMEAVGEG